MRFTKDDKQVIQSFMDQAEMKSFKCWTDGQSLFYGKANLRIAEHVPHQDGGATTLLYDFTQRGNAFIDRHSQWMVYQVKNMIPRQNLVNVHDAQQVGLVEDDIEFGDPYDTPRSTR
jgi:hypothetical protein